MRPSNTEQHQHPSSGNPYPPSVMRVPPRQRTGHTVPLGVAAVITILVTLVLFGSLAAQWSQSPYLVNKSPMRVLPAKTATPRPSPTVPMTPGVPPWVGG